MSDGRFVEEHESPPVRWTWENARLVVGVVLFIVVGNFVLRFTDVGHWIQCHQSILQSLGFDPTIASCN